MRVMTSLQTPGASANLVGGYGPSRYLSHQPRTRGSSERVAGCERCETNSNRFPSSILARRSLPIPLAAGTRDTIPETSVAAYDSCVGLLTELGMAEADAEKAILTAFGHGSQLYWRQEKVKEAPEPEVVATTLVFLEERLNLEAAEDKLVVIKKFPELLTIDPALMEENLAKLTDRFNMKGTMLTNSIRRKPRVLGATTDCAGDCAGDCTRCFAQF